MLDPVVSKEGSREAFSKGMMRENLLPQHGGFVSRTGLARAPMMKHAPKEVSEVYIKCDKKKPTACTRPLLDNV